APYDGLRERLLDYHSAHQRPSASAELQRCYQGLGELALAVFGHHPDPAGPVATAAEPQRARTQDVTTRQSFQVAAAAALAGACGLLLSHELWYWAVVTAWVVYVKME